MEIKVICWLICFLAFGIIQGLIINGIHYCFQGGCINEINKGKVCAGNIFYMLAPGFFENNKSKWWSKPLWSCVKCMSSIWSIPTYWPVVLWTFGFEWWQIGIWVADIFMICSLNYYIYKKL